MKSLPLEIYPSLARKAVIYLRAAKTLHEIQNRSVGSEEVEYYLLSHAIELAIKAGVEKESGKRPPKGHDLKRLVFEYQKLLNLTNRDLICSQNFDDLNFGNGGLRYDNKPIGDFYPYLWEEGIELSEKLLKGFE